MMLMNVEELVADEDVDSSDDALLIIKSQLAEAVKLHNKGAKADIFYEHLFNDNDGDEESDGLFHSFHVPELAEAISVPISAEVGLIHYFDLYIFDMS